MPCRISPIRRWKIFPSIRLSADLNSVPGGRLQVVFHIKGRSDPPKPQQAKVGLIDLLNGTALQKPIPLPSGTPDRPDLGHFP